MTAQLSDRLHIDLPGLNLQGLFLYGVVVADDPLSADRRVDYPFRSKPNPDKKRSSTALYRGYVSVFRISATGSVMLEAFDYSHLRGPSAPDTVHETLEGDYWLMMRPGFAKEAVFVPVRDGVVVADRSEWRFEEPRIAPVASLSSDKPRTYAPQAFREFDLAALDALFAANPFVTLISSDEDGAPFVGHLPVLYQRQGQGVRIEGHWSRANPQAKHRGPMLMIVHGPSAYVSPGWYPDKEEAARVPTWNYAVAHLQGEPFVYDDETALAGLVDRLSAHYEAGVGGDWRFEVDREDHRTQLRGIVGFAFAPRRIDLKFKLSQNHPPANRAAVRDAFASRGGPAAAQLAAWMAERESGGAGEPSD